MLWQSCSSCPGSLLSLPQTADVASTHQLRRLSTQGAHQASPRRWHSAAPHPQLKLCSEWKESGSSGEYLTPQTGLAGPFLLEKLAAGGCSGIGEVVTAQRRGLTEQEYRDPAVPPPGREGEGCSGAQVVEVLVLYMDPQTRHQF